MDRSDFFRPPSPDYFSSTTFSDEAAAEASENDADSIAASQSASRTASVISAVAFNNSWDASGPPLGTPGPSLGTPGPFLGIPPSGPPSMTASIISETQWQHLEAQLVASRIASSSDQEADQEDPFFPDVLAINNVFT